MPINPIKEQRISAKKYIIGYYSTNIELIKKSLQSDKITYEFIDLNNLDMESAELYLSIIDELVYENTIPDFFSEYLTKNKTPINNITTTNIISSIQERSKLIIDLKKEKNSSSEKNLKFIMQIATILENKDPYTKDHSARVAKYSLAIAEEYFNNQYDELYGFLKEQDSEQYEKLKHDYIIKKLNLTMLSAWAHDIGKNSIAQNLLNKDSKLTEDEYDIMKMHADFGANIIRKILGNEEFAEIIENHHERIDGQGYHHLEEFSDISKIIAIADSFDAMTTTRPYTTKNENTTSTKSKIKTIEEAINELQVSSHLHFDIEKNRMSQQLDTNLTNILVKILKKELSLIKEGKLDEVKLLSGGLDKNGYLKAGYWDDITQTYSKDTSVLDNRPNYLQ